MTLVLFVLAAPVVSLIWLSRLSTRLRQLTSQVEELRRAAGQAPATGAPPAVPDADLPVPHAGEGAGAPAERPAVPEVPAAAAPGVGETATGPAGGAPAGAAPDAEPPLAPSDIGPEATPDAGPAPGASWEERLAARWMIWLGGATVALAAVFLFRYAIDEGWLTPLARVLLGLGLGGVLLGAGERAQRAPLPMAGRIVNPDHVPAALSAAGIFAVFVSLFAAHGLYGLMGPAAAFVALALTAYSALALSLRQGWFVALLGLLAGYLVPALIDSPEPNAPATFLYLFVLSLGALGLMVWRRWRWFSGLTIAGALLWPCLWSFGGAVVADELTLGLYVLALAAAFAGLSTELPLQAPRQTLLRWIVAVVGQSAGIGFALCGALLLHLAGQTGFDAGGFAFLVLYAALALGLGLWRERLESLIALAALVALAAALLWPQPYGVTAPERVQELGLGAAGTALGPYVMPPEFYAFSRALWGFAAVFGLGGFLAVFRVRARPLWAGLSAFLPVILLAAGYWRIAAFRVDIDWAIWAMALAVLLVLAATAVARRLAAEQRDLPLALYAAGATAAIALAFVCILREAWLSVALAGEVAALSWIWSGMRLRELRTIASAVLLVVAVRLVVNPQVLDYRGAVFGLFGWVLYGYGLPAVFTGFAARVFARGGRDTAVVLCEIAAAGFGFLMVALQLRIWSSGSLDAPSWLLRDSAIQSVWWIVGSMLLLDRRFAGGRAWAQAAGQLLLGASGALVIFGSLVANNPVFEHEWVGRGPVFNLISLAYLVPALLYAAMAWAPRFVLPGQLRGLFGVIAGILVFADLTLEVRHAFWGSHMTLTAASLPADGEIYAYSAAWIVFALGLLAGGILRRSQALRYASLVALMVTVAKVFLYDMSDLTGLFRVASFLGLGLTLIAIGRIYRVYVFRRP